MTKADYIMEKLANVQKATKTQPLPGGEFLTNTVLEFDTPDGKRLYEGEGKSNDKKKAKRLAEAQALLKFKYIPSDSLRTEHLKTKY